MPVEKQRPASLCRDSKRDSWSGSAAALALEQRWMGQLRSCLKLLDRALPSGLMASELGRARAHLKGRMVANLGKSDKTALLKTD